jgi:cyclic pyranopterin phosphate synthase
LTGGEPTIKKDFSNIIHELGKLPVELGLTTNAVIIDRYIDELKAAGIKSINVSLDSLKEERFNKISRREYFTKIKENITLLIANDFKVKSTSVYNGQRRKRNNRNHCQKKRGLQRMV